MSQGVILSQRDLALLRLLDVTPATAAHIRKASDAFDGGAFRDGRRVRERLQTLANAGFVKSWPAAVPGGGLMSYYRLTLEGHRAAFPDTIDTPPRTSLHEIVPSRIRHAFATADVIVHCLVGCHRRNVRVLRALGDGRLTLQVGEYRQQPDFHLQLSYAGRTFNLVFEIDNATEPLDSHRGCEKMGLAPNLFPDFAQDSTGCEVPDPIFSQPHREQSIRTKILGYETYQDWVLRLWKESGEEGPRPSFRVAFLTTSAERANHILWLARELARNKDRRLVYASTQDVFLGEPLAVTQPILNDHHGHWQPLVNAQPSSRFLREPIYLRQPIAPGPGL